MKREHGCTSTPQWGHLKKGNFMYAKGFWVASEKFKLSLGA